MRSNPLLALLFLACLAVGPARAEWRDIAYSDMAKMPLALKKADPQGVYSYFYKAQPGEGQTELPADLKLQVVTSGKAIPIPIQPDGRFDLPIRQDWLDASAKVQSNQPKDKVGLGFTLSSRVPPGTQMTYGQLTESVPVLERGIKQMAGLMSFLAPKVQQVLLKFDKATPQTLTLTLPDGQKKIWKTDADGQIRLPWQPDWSRLLVVLSAPLKGVDPVLK